jgi:type VI secretion system ImpA family protein
MESQTTPMKGTAGTAEAANSLDLDALLRPITAGAPCGSDLRYEGTYDAIREARRSDDPNLPQGVWVTDIKRANWRDVARMCTNTLTERSKDVQVAVWLTEAMVQNSGFAGARDGLALLRALCEAFWDDLHPLIAADGDMEMRITPLVWLNDRLPQLLRILPITHPETGDERQFCWDDWENAGRLEVLAQKDRAARDRAEAGGKPSRAKVLTSVTLTPASFYMEISRVTAGCLLNLADLEALLDEKCGTEAPSFNTIRTQLEHIRGQVIDFLREKGVEVDEKAPSPAEAAASPGKAGQPAELPLTLAAIRSRDEAYRMLSLAAEYLMRTEPHSPSPYLVRRAVMWGSMSLDELLHELIGNEADLGQLFSLLGMSKALPPKGSKRG